MAMGGAGGGNEDGQLDGSSRIVAFYHQCGGPDELCVVAQCRDFDTGIGSQARDAMFIQRLLDRRLPDLAGGCTASAEYDRLGIEKMDENGDASSDGIAGLRQEADGKLVTVFSSRKDGLGGHVGVPCRQVTAEGC